MEMKCPNCCSDIECYAVLMPRTHLSVGKTVFWCGECGTVFTNPDGTNKVKKLRVPRQTKQSTGEEDGPNAFSGIIGE